MLFSSIIFIVYFLPVAIAGYYLLRFSRSAQNVWLLITSLAFYSWGEPVLALVLPLSLLVNYFTALAIDKLRENRRKSLALAVASCLFNLGVLFVCKQLWQIVTGVMDIFTPAGSILPSLPIPLGVSFFTLRAVSYVTDVYKGRAESVKNPIHAALYLAFFPTLIAGPVMRYSEMETQFMRRRESWQFFSGGVCKFIAGLAKKVLIANTMSEIADHVFNYSAMSNEVIQVPASVAWLGAIAFMLQIYFDLSGYSDMAVGLGRMFGFELKENFDYPYMSLSMNEFWEKWNVTLIGWFREYVYNPLGGSLVRNNDKMVKNLFLLWLSIGIWHGAKWTFVLWGAWQFLFLVFESVIDYDNRRLPRFLRRAYVLTVTLFGFVIFRTNDIYQATLYFSNMFGFNHNGFFSDTALMFIREFWLFLAVGVLFATPVARMLPGVASGGSARKYGGVLSVLYSVLMTVAFYAAMTYIVRDSGYPFIYFRF